MQPELMILNKLELELMAVNLETNSAGWALDAM